jgi:hypothetical protein
VDAVVYMLIVTSEKGLFFPKKDIKVLEKEDDVLWAFLKRKSMIIEEKEVR